VRTDVKQWREIRRRVLAQGASKRSIQRDFGPSWKMIDKILEHPEPPGYRTNAHGRSRNSAPTSDNRQDPGCRLGAFDAPKRSHTAKRNFARLCDKYGYPRSMSHVRAHVTMRKCRGVMSSSRPSGCRAKPSSTSARGDRRGPRDPPESGASRDEPSLL
jgi:hypothetical protein